jgi:hypothetical protein
MAQTLNCSFSLYTHHASWFEELLSCFGYQRQHSPEPYVGTRVLAPQIAACITCRTYWKDGTSLLAGRMSKQPQLGHAN